MLLEDLLDPVAIEIAHHQLTEIEVVGKYLAEVGRETWPFGAVRLEDMHEQLVWDGPGHGHSHGQNCLQHAVVVEVGQDHGARLPGELRNGPGNRRAVMS